MGTKLNPGQFDCHDKAEPDEPMFILLGRDPDAGALVNLWALLRHRRNPDDPKIAEAMACAKSMDRWARSLGRNPYGSESRAAIEAALIAVTAGMYEHPESYDDCCDCDLCRSYT